MVSLKKGDLSDNRLAQQFKLRSRTGLKCSLRFPSAVEVRINCGLGRSFG
jgi:hypothetical protein